MTRHRGGGAVARRLGSGGGADTGRVVGGRGDGQSEATAARGPGASYAVAAQRQPLTTNAKSPVAHDTETEALVAQSGRVFAATGQWEYPGPSAFGQVLVKKSKTSPWTVFEQTQSLRVQALDSFPIPSDQGLGPGHSLLVTQAIVAGQVEDPVVARRRQLLLPSQFVRTPRRRRRSCFRGARERAGFGPSMPEFARRGSSRGCGHQLATPWCSVPSPSSRWPRQGRRVR